MSKKPRHLRTISNHGVASFPGRPSLMRDETPYEEIVGAVTMLPHLQELVSANISANVPVAPPPLVPASVKNVVKAANEFSQMMWLELEDLHSSSGRRDGLRIIIEATVDAIEMVCKEQGSSPYTMKAQSKQSFFWMKYLLSGDNLKLHLNALKIAKEQADASGFDAEVHLVNSGSKLFSIKREGNRVSIKAHEAFILADASIWRELFHVARTDCSAARQKVGAFEHTAEFRQVEEQLIQLMCSCNLRHHHD